MDNANLVLTTGKSMYNNTKHLIWCGPFGLGSLLITLFFCGEYAPLYLIFSGDYEIVNVLIGLWYLLIVIGICVVFPYFMGLVLIGIGQIAENTILDKDMVREPVHQPAPTPVAAPKKTAKISIALLNSLRTALKEPYDAELVKRLEETKQRLTNPNEKQIIQQILDAGQVRTAAQYMYNKFNQ